MEQPTNDEQWTEVIKPHQPWYDLKLRELWRYRDLVRIFIWRDFVAAYKQTLLGPFWHVINPVLSILLYYILFSQVAQLSTNGTPPFLFQFGSFMCWTFFVRCFSVAQSTFLGNSGIFSKVYFPRLAVPVSGAISGLLQFGILFAGYAGIWLYQWNKGAQVEITGAGVAWFFPLMFIMTIMGLGAGFVVAALTTKYRDLSLFVGYGISLLMYVSAVVYPASEMGRLAPKYEAWFWYNPIVPLMEGLRFSILGTPTLHPSLIGYSAAFAVGLFLLGLVMFNRTERTFIDTV
ncbi:MAG: ABC transporter permease [Bernardetiaceae bacterium]|nr:ABC transporter permease [Bernardetiaceae bacterium]